MKSPEPSIDTIAGDWPMVEAQFESMGVQPGFSKGEVERMLRAAAERRARTLRCQELVGFN